MIKSNKKTILTLMICIISLLIIISSSTAAFYYNYKGNKNETVINDAEIRLLESDKKVIKIENALPMSDKQGKTQEETFDFEVRTKTKKEMPLIYNLTLEKKGTKCSNIENPTKEDYPSCYDFELSTSDKNAIINYIVEYWEFPKEEATTYIELQLNKDFDGLVNFYMEVPGAPEEVALEWATHDEEDGYINWVINDYKYNTGNNLESSYVFNKNNYINYELKYCSTIENPTKENNPKCYFTISEEEEMELKNWMKYFFNITYKNPNALYDAILSHDNQGIYDFLITEGWSTNFAKSFISDFEKNNYEEFLISLYEDDTGNTLSVNTEFNGDNKYVYRYLNDHEIKVYIEDYEGNVILEPTLVSELAKNDYILHRKTSNHNMENEEYINKYKLRVWIDEQTDSTYWNEHSNINYEFKIGVATDYQKYQVRYNSNGGNEGLYITSEDYPWAQTKGRYQSGNSYIDNSKSTLTFNSFLITEPTEISFDIAVSAEMNDYAEYTIYKNGIPLEESTKIYGSGIVGGPVKNTHQDIKPSSLTELDKKGRIINTDAIEADLVVRNIRKVLEPGIYKIEVSYVKDSELEAGEDSAYIGNMNFLPWIGKMANSTHIIGQKSNLNINVYEKQYHDFAGWSTTPDGKAIYKDKEEVLNLSKNDGDIIDLYAVWEKKKYEVNLIVQNGIINGESTKQISALENAIFDVIPNNENLMEIMECTNNETAIYENNKLTIENITSNTTCTLKFEEELTTFYEDGTLVINENKNQRTSNITEHGEIIKEYEGLSETQSYVFGPEEISDSEAEEQSLNLETQTTTQPVLWKDEKEQITNVEIGNVILPTSTAYWFQNCTNLSLGDFENLDTSETIDMSSMFQGTGNDATSLELIGLDKFDTSKVENMSYMFDGAGTNSETIKLGNLSGWDTSNVTDMKYMFSRFGYCVETLEFSGIENWNTSKATDFSSMFENALANFDIINFDLSSWNTSKVTDFSDMFYFFGSYSEKINMNLSNWNFDKAENITDMYYNMGSSAATFSLDVTNQNISGLTSLYSIFDGLGRYATTFSLIGLNTWNTSNVTNMSYMFSSAGYKATSWTIGDLSSWDTSKVTDMGSMFLSAGYTATEWNVGTLSSWNTSNVEDMSFMFTGAGYNSSSLNLNLSNWNVSKVTDMSDMFANIGYKATSWTIGNLSSWNPIKVTNMGSMFYQSGYNASEFNLGDISSWDTSQVSEMAALFYGTGHNATSWNIGTLSSWNTAAVTDMNSMFEEAGYKTQTMNLNLSSWNVSNVTKMYDMFKNFGYSATSWTIGDLSKWNTQKLYRVDMMFYQAGYKAETFNLGDLSSWDTSKISNFSYMFYFSGSASKTWNIGDVSSWNTSNATNMDLMFQYAGHNAEYTLDLSGWNVEKVTKHTYFNGGVTSKITPPVWVN